MTTYRRLLLSVPLWMLGACGSEQALTPEEYDDVAESVAALTFDSGGDLEAAGDAAGAASGNAPGALSSTATGSFSGQRGSLTYSYTIECRSARDQILDACDWRTRMADVDVSIEGELATRRREGALLRTGSWALTWDGQSLVTIDGQTLSDVATTFESMSGTATRSYVMVAQGTYSGLELDLASQRFGAGRIELTVDAERTRTSRFKEIEARFSVEAVIELTPNGPALITLDKERNYRADPVTFEVEPL